MDEQLFSSPLAKSPAASQDPHTVSQVASIAARIKIAEERYANLQRRNRLTEESLLSFEKDTRAQIRAIGHQVNDLRKKISEIGTRVDAMTGEMESIAKKHELAVVERYLDLWQPVQFVTREEAKRLIQDAVTRRESNA